jgi:hypothetical protein
MKNDTKIGLILLLMIVAIYYFYTESRNRRDSDQRVIGMVQQFCRERGGVKNELTDDIEAEYRHFTVECNDGSVASGFYDYPDVISFYDPEGNEISFWN